ncbi:MAG TPA: cupredoxin domain-containing protein [bacterium]|nr:cupredoxin domain-containing protein [bacterium]
MRKTWWIGVALVTLAVAGCGPKDTGQPAPGTPQEKGAVTIVGKDNVFEPDTIEIKAGREYEITFKNEGTTVHNLIVQAKDTLGQDFASDAAVNAGETDEFSVTISREGSYKMTCTYHPEMIGTLKVVK